jgi:hypothetical protein
MQEVGQLRGHQKGYLDAINKQIATVAGQIEAARDEIDARG